MAFKFKDGDGTIRTASALKFMDAGRTIHSARTIKFKDATTLRTIATFTTPMTVSVSSPYLLASGAGSSVTTDALTATPTGGTAPYTYLWSRVGSCTITNTTSASTTFSEFGLGFSEDRISTVTVTATDSAGQSNTDSATVEIIRYDFGGFA
jgi:hypothetical protein